MTNIPNTYVLLVFKENILRYWFMLSQMPTPKLAVIISSSEHIFMTKYCLKTKTLAMY